MSVTKANVESFCREWNEFLQQPRLGAHQLAEEQLCRNDLGFLVDQTWSVIQQ